MSRAFAAARFVLVVPAFVFVLCPGPATLEAAPRPATAAGRLVVIGDLHADPDAARAAFQLAGATNLQDDWIGGDLVIVQLGDLIGRGPDDRAVLDFVFAIRAKAKAAGGTVHVLIGNHEIFGARLEVRWVDPNAFAAFVGLPGLALNDPALAVLDPAMRARGAALKPGGPYARKLSELPAVLRLGRTIFVHGGVTPQWAAYGIDRINREVSQWLSGQTRDEPPSSLGLDDGSSDDGVMWSRHFAVDAGPQACAMLERSLAILGAARMVVGHTVQRTITSRCDDRAWAVDVGMSRFYGGPVEVLEILNDESVTVLRSRR